MPGPISDSRDPEFGTGANARAVREAIDAISARIGGVIGHELRFIVDVVDGHPGPAHPLLLSERELRVIRFALNRASESI
jgi:hypothetical protein